MVKGAPTQVVTTDFFFQQRVPDEVRAQLRENDAESLTSWTGCTRTCSGASPFAEDQYGKQEVADSAKNRQIAHHHSEGFLRSHTCAAAPHISLGNSTASPSRKSSEKPQVVKQLRW